jgi:hypothetical protein
MRILRWLAAALIGSAAVPAAAQPATQPQAMERAYRIVEQVIGLAVAEARCTGRHQKMVARYRPFIMRSHEARIMLAGQWLANGYRQSHGEAWREALTGELARIRIRLEQQPDPKRFCKQAAIAARDWSDGHPPGEPGAITQQENEVIRRLIVAGL